MVGSGMPETYELYLLMKYVKKVVDKYDRDVVVPAELAVMLTTVEDALDELENAGYEDPEELPHDVPESLFEYWDVVASARENYRNDVQYYFSGNTTNYEAKTVSKMLKRWIEHVEVGMERSMKFGTKGASGIAPSFFSYDITDWELNGNKNLKGLPLVNAKAMKVGIFPLFLEGPVRYMKTIQDDPDTMTETYERVLTSGLRDEELGMYYLSASLAGETYDMGRQIAFAPGWLENQSIWMHMSYKYYLQLIRGKLYDQFFSEMRGSDEKQGGILPFMDPQVYGRPLMECSSFIASSAFPDPGQHGRGFLARLSGSTAEFMDMWKLMFIGPTPFFLNDSEEVEMQLVPALPSWLFEDESSDSDPNYDEDGNLVVIFKLFAQIPVTYHNPEGRNLYGEPPKSYKVTMADGSVVDVDGPTIPTKTAIKIRRVSSVSSIDAYF
jgi:hypothetical protein